jgi:hypothetical protein
MAARLAFLTKTPGSRVWESRQPRVFALLAISSLKPGQNDLRNDSAARKQLMSSEVKNVPGRAKRGHSDNSKMPSAGRARAAVAWGDPRAGHSAQQPRGRPHAGDGRNGPGEAGPGRLLVLPRPRPGS